jgi:hypothetical protein
MYIGITSVFFALNTHNIITMKMKRLYSGRDLDPDIAISKSEVHSTFDGAISFGKRHRVSFRV